MQFVYVVCDYERAQKYTEGSEADSIASLFRMVVESAVEEIFVRSK